MSTEQPPTKKENCLRALEFLSLFAFMSTRIFVEVRWIGVAVTALFGVLYALLYFKRVKHSRRKFIIDLAIGIPLFLTFIYVAFFLKK